MRVTTNDKLAERQTKIARYATFGGLAVLVASLFTSFSGNFPLTVAYGLLIVGFFLAYIGAILGNKWMKEPRADHALTKALLGFDKRHHLFNYFFRAPHVLLTPNGLLVFRVKSNDGRITCSNDRWSAPFRWTRIIGGMGQEALGNPSADLREDIANVKKMLANNEGAAATIPVDGYIVFADPRAELHLDGCSIPVVRIEDLKDTLRKSKRGPALQPDLLEQLDQALTQAANEKAAK